MKTILPFLALSAFVSSLSFAQDQSAPPAYDVSLQNGVDAAVSSALSQHLRGLGNAPLLSLGPVEAGAVVGSAVIDGTTLHLSFDEGKVAALINGTLPVAGANAASTAAPSMDGVAAFIVNRSANQSVIEDPDGDPASADLDRVFSENGVRLVFPSFNDDSLKDLNDASISGRNLEVLNAAARRCGAAKYLAGGLTTLSDGSVQVDLDLYDNGGNKLSSFGQSGALRTVVKSAADKLAAVINPSAGISINGGEASARVAPAADGSPEQSREAVSTSALSAGAEILEPGAYTDLVRVAFSGTRNINDLKAIRYALTTFGYEHAVRLRGYSAEGVIMEIPTSGSPAILDATLSHAPEFTKIGPWRFQFNNSSGTAPSGRGGMGPAPADRVTSDMVRTYSD